MARFIASLIVALGAWSGADAAELIESYTLPNGLKVVLAPDHNVPKVVMNVRYSVGSMNEPAGRSGFAHLFEHLMFSGTEAWPDAFAAHAALGNNINAWTMEDGTVYYVEGLSSNLPMILSLEADRMANLGGNVDQSELDLQRSVVKNEMRQNVLDQAGAAPWEAFWSGLFSKPHPYSRTVIGSIADLDSATLDDVRGFFDTYYVPNNAALVLTGDFDIAATRALVEKTFGVVPRGADVPRPSAPAVQPAKLHLELKDRVPNPIVAAGFTGPAVGSPQNGALAIAAELLGNGDVGFLRRRLVGEEGVATYASATWTPGLLGGRFTVEAGAAEGVTAETLEQELNAAIRDFLSAPVEAADIERARRGILLAGRMATESLKDRTDALAYQVDMYGKVTYGTGNDPFVANATAGDVTAALKTVVNPDAESVLVIRPGPRGGYPAVLTDSSGTPVPFSVEQRKLTEVPKLPVGEPKTASLPAMRTATLSNGVKLVHYDMPSAPVAYIAAAAKGGWSNAPEGKEGLLTVAAGMAVRGAGDREYDAFAKATKDVGATISYSAATMSTSLMLSVPADSLDAGVGLLADAVLKPRFDTAEWTIAQGEVQDWLSRREADLPGVAERAATRTLFPAKSGEAGPDWSFKATRSISLEDARAAFRETFRPSEVTFYSVGPLPIEAVKASLERAFGGWNDGAAGYVAQKSPPAAFAGRAVLLVPEPGASQSALYVVRPAPGLDEPRRSEAVAVSRLLGGDFNSRLNSVIREEKGYSYGVDSYLLDTVRNGSGIVVATTVQRDSTGPALAEILKGFDGLTSVPVTAEEVDRTVTSYRQTLAGEAETASGLFEDLMSAIGSGQTLEENHAWREAKTRLTVDAVGAEAKALASLDPSLIVVAGDPEIVLPQLKAIGFDKVVTVERESMPQPSALVSERALEPEGEAPAQMPQGSLAGRLGGTTESIHDCAKAPEGCAPVPDQP